ncbi:techylectin-5A [Caerostris darwini]|uniref:Techylectin-5A n=1 Tax=Caerostris darwini TaxID=1538125 RepID=A0AAV4RPQ8_9ARAC|nr:techylectin-5A [Caerostris darwini]
MFSSLSLIIIIEREESNIYQSDVDWDFKMKNQFRKLLYTCGVNLLIFLALSPVSGAKNTNCGEKEKARALLETAEELLTKAEVSYPTCTLEGIEDCYRLIEDNKFLYIRIILMILSRIYVTNAFYRRDIKTYIHSRLKIYHAWTLLQKKLTKFNAKNTNCGEKEKARALLETAEELLTKAEVSYPTCNDKTSSNQTDCGKKEKSLAYIEIAKNLISEVKDHFPSCPKGPTADEKPRDCSEISLGSAKQSGVYTIWPSWQLLSKPPLEVYCDMETEGGGWTVIQRRGSFPQQQDFNQDWENYKTGFGNISQEFWLGNDNIFALTNQKECEVRFDLEDDGGEHSYAVYEVFRIEGESTSYTLHIKNYSGNAGDGMKNYGGNKFSTKDKELTTKAEQSGGGWWFGDSRYSNPNGKFQSSYPKSIYWYNWRKYDGLKSVEIKIRPRQIFNEP